MPLDDDVVTATAWWVVPGDPQQLVTPQLTHLPAQYTLFGYGTTGKGIWTDDYQLPEVQGLFDDRVLAVSATSAGHGMSAVRVDAGVEWIPARAPGDTIPATAAVVTAVLAKDEGSPGKTRQVPEATATITKPTQVRALAAYLNNLPLQPAGGFTSCPGTASGTLTTLTLTFRARVAGPALATAHAVLTGCQSLQLTVAGRQPIGWGGDAGESWFNEVVRVTGLAWKLPG